MEDVKGKQNKESETKKKWEKGMAGDEYIREGNKGAGSNLFPIHVSPLSLLADNERPYRSRHNTSAATSTNSSRNHPAWHFHYFIEKCFNEEIRGRYSKSNISRKKIGAFTTVGSPFLGCLTLLLETKQLIRQIFQKKKFLPAPSST